jgi:hypothetical protein
MTRRKGPGKACGVRTSQLELQSSTCVRTASSSGVRGWRGAVELAPQSTELLPTQQVKARNDCD